MFWFNRPNLKFIFYEKIYEPVAISKISDKIKINVVTQYSNSGCRKKGHHVDYYYVDGQRIKCFTTQNVGLLDNTFVAKTKGYYKTRRGWQNRKVWIITGVSGLYRGDWTAFNNSQ